MSFPGCCRQLFPLERDVPLEEWLEEKLNGIVLKKVVFLLMFLAIAMNAHAFAEGEREVAALRSLGAVALASGALVHKLPLSRNLKHTILLGSIITGSAGLTMAGAMADDIITRHRAMGVAMISYKSIAVLMGLPFRLYAVFAMCDVLTGVMSLRFCAWKYGDELSLDHYAAVVFVTCTSVAFARALTSVLKGLCSLERDLTFERQANEMLTSTLCDAIFWLGVDGELVLRSDDRFDSLVGRNMLGESLQTCLPGADDLVRLQQVLSQAKSDDESTRACLLPSTLKNANGCFNVDMCIVSLKQGARSNFGRRDQNKHLLHLVGVRLMQQAPLASPALESHKGLESRAGPNSAPDPESVPDLESVPRTEAASAILLDPSCSMERIIKLGHDEHWLLDKEHVYINPGGIIGSGHFGAVVLAEIHGFEIALKIPKTFSSCNALDRSLANEIRIHRHLRHPNVVHFYGACIDADTGTLALAYEVVNGLPLDRFMHSLAGQAPLSTQHKIVLDVACALRYMHSMDTPIIHSDVKPSNAMVENINSTIRAKLLDFGLAQRLTGHGRWLGGTKQWTAPELVSRKNITLTPSVDVFSFGCLGIYVMTGERPGEASNLNGATGEGVHESFQARQGCEHGCDMCDHCLGLCSTCRNIAPTMRPSIAAVHANIRACPSFLSGAGGPLGGLSFAEREMGSSLVPWSRGIPQVLETEFADDKNSCAIIFDLEHPQLSIHQATKGWICTHGNIKPQGTPLCHYFDDDTVSKMVKDLQAATNTEINNPGAGMTPLRYPHCHRRHHDGTALQAAMVLSYPTKLPEEIDGIDISARQGCMIKLDLNDFRTMPLPGSSVIVESLWHLSSGSTRRKSRRCNPVDGDRDDSRSPATIGRVTL